MVGIFDYFHFQQEEMEIEMVIISIEILELEISRPSFGHHIDIKGGQKCTKST